MAEWPRGMPGALFPEQGSERDLQMHSILWESVLPRPKLPAQAPVPERRASFGGDTNQTLRNWWQLVTRGRAGLGLPYLGEWAETLVGQACGSCPLRHHNKWPVRGHRSRSGSQSVGSHGRKMRHSRAPVIAKS